MPDIRWPTQTSNELQHVVTLKEKNNKTNNTDGKIDTIVNRHSDTSHLISHFNKTVHLCILEPNKVFLWSWPFLWHEKKQKNKKQACTPHM